MEHKGSKLFFFFLALLICSVCDIILSLLPDTFLLGICCFSYHYSIVLHTSPLHEIEENSSIACYLTALGFIQATSAEDEAGEASDCHRAKASAPTASSTKEKQANWSKENLSPSDQKQTADAHSISSCIIPINVTGMEKKWRKKPEECVFFINTLYSISKTIV